MKPRVLIFSLAYFPFVGGAEVAVKETTDRLADRFDFDIISANVKNPRAKYSYPWWAAREAARRHRGKPYDLIWAIMANQAGMAAAMFKDRFPTVPFLLTLQEGDDFSKLAYKIRLLAPRFYRVFQRADHIQSISNFLARWARDMGAKSAIDVVPNGVDLEKFKPRREVGAPIAASEPPAKPVIITTSRLVPKNGVDTLIESMRVLPREIKLQILGTGPEESALKSQVAHYGLQDRIEFVGHISPNELPKWLAGADVFVRASRSEGLGISFLEAMAVGLPVVGTAVGGIPDFLTDGVTGWVCRVDDPKSIAEKVTYILDPANHEQVEKVKTEAVNLVRTRYNWDTIAKKMAQIMDKMAKTDRL